ncbi:MAG: hypothetical protein HKO91_10565 [Desulfobacterales bacterium]|nr:hypothetical protein [Desulfobacterales bacterium]
MEHKIESREKFSGNTYVAEELLLSHMAVVNGHGFRFNPLIRDNKLFGSGSIDVINAINFQISTNFKAKESHKME